MTVLRDRPTPLETSDPGVPQDQQDVTGRQLCSRRGQQPTADGAGDLLSKKIEAVVCNGNGIVCGSYKSQSKEKMLNSLIVFATCLKKRNAVSLSFTHLCPISFSLCCSRILGMI